MQNFKQWFITESNQVLDKLNFGEPTEDANKLASEAIFDPKITTPQIRKYSGEKKPFLSRNFDLTVDNKGNVVPHDFQDKKPYLTLIPNHSIQLQKMGPQSKEFRQIINALRFKYPNIDEYPVQHYFQAGHMQSAGDRERTVNYWMGKPEIRLNNKLPKYFYHGTSTNLWYEGIKEKGLSPRLFTGSTGSYGSQNISSLSKPNLVYLSTDPDAATREAAKQAALKFGGKPLIIRISSTGLDPNRFAPDEDTKAETPQGSVNVSSTLAYQGRIPAENLEPFLIGNTEVKNHLYQTNWKKFEDVPTTEHPLTEKLKKGQLPYSNEPEYLALKDAGIIGEKGILDKDITDEKIRSVLKKSGWTQNARAIISDFYDGYRGSLYQLKGIFVPDEETLQNKIITMLLDSGIINYKKYEDKFYFDVRNWNIEPYAIKLAKLMGKMPFQEFTSRLDQFVKTHQTN